MKQIKLIIDYREGNDDIYVTAVFDSVSDAVLFASFESGKFSYAAMEFASYSEAKRTLERTEAIMGITRTFDNREWSDSSMENYCSLEECLDENEFLGVDLGGFSDKEIIYKLPTLMQPYKAYIEFLEEEKTHVVFIPEFNLTFTF